MRALSLLCIWSLICGSSCDPLGPQEVADIFKRNNWEIGLVDTCYYWYYTTYHINTTAFPGNNPELPDSFDRPDTTIGKPGQYLINPIAILYIKWMIAFPNLIPSDSYISLTTLQKAIDCLNNVSAEPMSIHSQIIQCNENGKSLLRNVNLLKAEWDTGIIVKCFYDTPSPNECANYGILNLVNETYAIGARVQSPTPKGDDLTNGAIIGIVIGSVVFLLGVGMAVRYYRRQ